MPWRCGWLSSPSRPLSLPGRIHCWPAVSAAALHCCVLCRQALLRIPTLNCWCCKRSDSAAETSQQPQSEAALSPIILQRRPHSGSGVEVIGDHHICQVWALGQGELTWTVRFCLFPPRRDRAGGQAMMYWEPRRAPQGPGAGGAGRLLGPLCRVRTGC